MTPAEFALVVIRTVGAMAIMSGCASLGLAVVFFLLGVGLWKDYEIIIDPAVTLLAVCFVVLVPFGLLMLVTSRPLARFAARAIEQAPKEK